jgi:hypothetical protein
VSNNEVIKNFLELLDGKNEPLVPGLIKKSFFFVTSTGLREQPEMLLLELFREIFYKNFFGNGGQHAIDPEIKDSSIGEYSEEERAVLYLTRGRPKKGRNILSSGFFMPAYPSLARGGWFRKQSDRQLRDAMFRGFCAQYFKDSNVDSYGPYSEIIIKALVGHKSVGVAPMDEVPELLSAAISKVDIPEDAGLRNYEEAVEELNDIFSIAANGKDRNNVFKSSKKDIFSEILFSDLISICDLEASLPRLQWLEVIKCYLRISICSWNLAKMRLTVWLRDEIIKSIKDPDYIFNHEEFNAFLTSRYKNLFNASSTANDGLDYHVETYMKARVELSVLVYALQAIGEIPDVDKLELVVDDSRSGHITINDLMEIFHRSRNKFKLLSSDLDFDQWLIRICERSSAWTSPLEKGQGKNLSEFLRVLKRHGDGDGDFGFLITPVKTRNRTNNYKIFPGPMLIKLIVYLSSARKLKKFGGSEKKDRQLVLSEVEDHFSYYGIEFKITASARPELVNELMGLGLLNGSPDAGDSVAVKNPFKVD